MRQPVPFDSNGSCLVGTLDPAPGGRIGLLIVSGGNEVRSGAHRGMAMLAARVATTGFPVFRFDRSGVGDSSGPNRGFLGSAHDIFNATSAFENEADLDHVVAFGNCDAATALALFGTKDLSLSGLILANPWTIEQQDELPPPAAIRSRYAAKLRDPREVWRLLTGRVHLGKLMRGLRKSRQAAPAALAQQLSDAVAVSRSRVRVLAAHGDNTAIAFRAALPHVPVIERDTASHSFAGPGDADWLFTQVVSFLREATPPLP